MLAGNLLRMLLISVALCATLSTTSVTQPLVNAAPSMPIECQAGGTLVCFTVEEYASQRRAQVKLEAKYLNLARKCKNWGGVLGCGGGIDPFDGELNPMCGYTWGWRFGR